jgi:hypothetical protein
MKKVIVSVVVSIVLLFVFAQSCNAGLTLRKDWEQKDTNMLLLTSALLVIDWGQTENIAHNPYDFHETNPMLGDHPSNEQVTFYFAGALVLNAAIQMFLPPKERRIWQWSVTIAEGNAIVNNFSVGLKF